MPLEVHRLEVTPRLVGVVQMGREQSMLEGCRPYGHLRPGPRSHIRVHIVQLGERAPFLVPEDGRLSLFAPPLVTVLVVGHGLKVETALLVFFFWELPLPRRRSLNVLRDLVEIPDDGADPSLDELPLVAQGGLRRGEGHAPPVRAADRLLERRLHQGRQLLLR